ncbi:hypothetical protein NPIL_628321 [Nephila pilipes]|uniref:Uncharacterized protein n=1 Tax=Nephila pilipes TaxID=299642 RepID=A0A8X6TTZ9_NEPPI|nr:hypothetical protein NPIL_628321 [Nephila pilipes]
MHSKNGLPIEDKVSEKIDTGEARRKKTRQESDKELKGKIMDEIDDKKIKTQKKGKQVDEVAILKKGVEETKREKAHDEMAAMEVGRKDYEGKGKKTFEKDDGNDKKKKADEIDIDKKILHKELNVPTIKEEIILPSRNFSAKIELHCNPMAEQTLYFQMTVRYPSPVS